MEFYDRFGSISDIRLFGFCKELHQFLNVVSDVTSELELGTLLTKVMSEAAHMLNADRSTLFMNDDKTDELFSRVAMGDSLGEIRLPNHLGIAGAVFSSGETINIPYAYADLRFNPAFDKKTGYFTRSILCIPVVNKDGKTIGVTQVLNKSGGPFTDEDETRLKAFTAQISIALENAKLFEDVHNMKNYNESMLESMSNGVITMDEDGKVVTCNAAGLRIIKTGINDIVGKQAEDFFVGANAWLMERIKRVEETLEQDVLMDAELEFGDEDEKETISANVNLLPLIGEDGKTTTENLEIVRDDFWVTTSNKQLNFVQHIKTILDINGRAGVVLPDNVLFEGGAGETLRKRLLKEFDVHTLVRLPTGIFYAGGVKANVLFFDKRPASDTETPWTEKLWVYDFRTNQHFTMKQNPLRRSHLDEFVECYKPGRPRGERVESERFKAFTYDELMARDKANLDLVWLKDDSIEDAADLPAPEVLAREIMGELEVAVGEFAAIVEALDSQ